MLASKKLRASTLELEAKFLMNVCFTVSSFVAQRQHEYLFNEDTWVSVVVVYSWGKPLWKILLW